jgi:hypothetical protein
VDAIPSEVGLFQVICEPLPTVFGALILLLLIGASILKLWKSREPPQVLMTIGSIAFAIMGVLWWYQYDLFSYKTPDGDNRWVLHLPDGWEQLRNVAIPTSGLLFVIGYLWEACRTRASSVSAAEALKKIRGEESPK